MASFLCNQCSNTFVDDSLPRRGAICFKCHIKGIRLGFTQGKEEFKGPTIGERQRKTVADAAAKGIKAEPVGQRWVQIAMESWIVPVLVAIIGGPLMVLMQILRKENTTQHNQGQELLKEVINKVDNVGTKIDSHIGWHDGKKE